MAFVHPHEPKAASFPAAQPALPSSATCTSLHTVQVYLAAVDAFGNLDPSPLVVPLATAPDTAPPALLPASGPTAITASGFGVTLSMDAAGAAYYMLLAAKPGVELQEPAVEAGSWAALSGLPGAGGSRRRRLFGDGGELVLGGLAAGGDSSGSSSGSGSLQRSGAGGHRLLAAAAPAAGPGSLVAPTCYSANVTCQASPTAVFTRTPGLSAFNVVASGCTQGPPAGQTFALPPASGLQNNTLYYLLVATEGRQVPSPALQGPPAMYAVRTVDLSAARFGCGFPTVTNITASSLAVSVLLTKPAWAFWVVIPSSQVWALALRCRLANGVACAVRACCEPSIAGLSAAGGASRQLQGFQARRATAAALQVGSAPSAADVLRGQGAGGQGVAVAGNMTRSGSLPWEAPASGTGDSRKLWASVGGLQSGVSYTVGGSQPIRAVVQDRASVWERMPAACLQKKGLCGFPPATYVLSPRHAWQDTQLPNPQHHMDRGKAMHHTHFWHTAARGRRKFHREYGEHSPSFFLPSQVFVALTLDGNAPLPGAPVARVSDVFTPATAPPTITAVQAVNVTVDEAAGAFSLALNATLDRAGVVYYALYRCALYTSVFLCPQMPAHAFGTGMHELQPSAEARRVFVAAAMFRPTGAPTLASCFGRQLNAHCTSYTARHLCAACLVSHRAYSCISGDPSVSDILSGASLAPSICPCSESWYCRWVVLVLRVGGWGQVVERTRGVQSCSS